MQHRINADKPQMRCTCNDDTFNINLHNNTQPIQWQSDLDLVPAPTTFLENDDYSFLHKSDKCSYFIQQVLCLYTRRTRFVEGMYLDHFHVSDKIWREKLQFAKLRSSAMFRKQYQLGDSLLVTNPSFTTSFCHSNHSSLIILLFNTSTTISPFSCNSFSQLPPFPDTFLTKFNSHSVLTNCFPLSIYDPCFVSLEEHFTSFANTPYIQPDLVWFDSWLHWLCFFHLKAVTPPMIVLYHISPGHPNHNYRYWFV